MGHNPSSNEPNLVILELRNVRIAPRVSENYVRETFVLSPAAYR